MIGTRLPDETDWSSNLPYGSYWKLNGTWYCIAPDGSFGRLSNHNVVEHEDGTITVTPSILISSTSNKNQVVQKWHGFLERGIWRSC